MNVGFDTGSSIPKERFFSILIPNSHNQHILYSERTYMKNCSMVPSIEWSKSLWNILCGSCCILIWWTDFFRTSSWKKEHGSRPWETLSGLDEVSILNFLVFHFWLPWKTHCYSELVLVKRQYFVQKNHPVKGLHSWIEEMIKLPQHDRHLRFLQCLRLWCLQCLWYLGLNRDQ